MRTHTNNYKTAIGTAGREIKSKISYTINGNETLIDDDDIFGIKYIVNTDILKSAMKGIEITLENSIPINTTLNFQFGVKIGEDYEYLNFGNYIVFESEKQEDLHNYKITCYDKMLLSMVDYDSPNVTYPTTIRNYLNAICNKLGITFANINDNFANYNRQINEDLYKDQGYTFRDVLDELAQVTASTICINANDELEIRYITNTSDIINEDYLKNINVTFGEKYGPVNSIVLSRSAESDNVYIKDDTSIEQNGLCEIKIKDNQIMNFNDRSDYLPDIFSKLGGLEYYINDYSSTGITYYDICDRYSVQIGEQTYSCVMFNDEIDITQGLEEKVYTEIPEESVTDYTKADKTDRKINQTYLIVDKQNQAIEGVVKEVTDTGDPNTMASKVSSLRIDVDGLIGEVQNVTGMVMTKDSMSASVTFTDTTNQSEPVTIKIHPITTNISYLYPYDGLYPSNTLYMPDRIIKFHNNTTNEDFDYVLPDDLLYYDSEHYDEFYLDLSSETCQVTKRCKYNSDATVSLLSSERIDSYTYEHINLTEGAYTVSISGYNSGFIYVTLMAKNIYTDQFYTKAETNSKIEQTATDITTAVNTKFTRVDGKITEQNSKIAQNSSSITTEVTRASESESELSSRISQTATGISLTVNNGSTTSGITITTTKEDGTTATTSGTINMSGLVTFNNLNTSGQTQINGANITTGTIKSSNYVSGTSGTSINLSTGVIDTKNFKISSTGNITATGGTIGGWKILDARLKASNGKAGMSSSTISSDPAFWAGYGDPWEHNDWATNTPFYVTQNGYLRATNVSISGYVNATDGNFTGKIYAQSGGTIGDWIITSSGISGTGTYGGQTYTVNLTPVGIELPGIGRTIRWIDL